MSRTTRVVGLVGIAAAGLGAAALATIAFAAPPRVIEIQVPDPTPVPARAPPQVELGPDGQPLPPGATGAGGGAGGHGGRPTRSEPREVKGDPPATLWGRYEIVQVTADGETEDFKVKMDREGKALELDCITVRRVFDFGPLAPSPGLPAAVMVSEQQECRKGGLGKYANELTVVLPAAWSSSDGGLVLTLPPVQATASLVRVRKPSPEDLHAPPHWLGPKSVVDRDKTEYQVRAELPPARPKKKKADEAEETGDPPLVVHLVAPDATYHLEPEPPDGPFGR